MTFGPIQLIALGFQHPNFHGEIRSELAALRGNDSIRVLDGIVVYKDAYGGIEIEDVADSRRNDEGAWGSKIGALVGLSLVEQEPSDDGSGVGTAGNIGNQVAADMEDRVSSKGEAWDVIGDVPNGSIAILLLVEHAWSVPLRNAIARAHGYRVGDGFISPQDLVELGVVEDGEVDELPHVSGVGIFARRGMA